MQVMPRPISGLRQRMSHGNVKVFDKLFWYVGNEDNRGFS